MHNSDLYKIEFYVPSSHLEAVKSAMFDVGAGRVGNYDCCSWQTSGEGQYRPLEGSQPFFGEQDRVEYAAEYKVEMVCSGEFVKAVIGAMKATHPYEEIAYCVIRTVV